MAESKTKALVKVMLKAADEMKAALSIYGDSIKEASKSQGAYSHAVRMREKVDVDALRDAAQTDRNTVKKAKAVLEAKSDAMFFAAGALKIRLAEKKKVKNPFKKLNVAKAENALEEVAKLRDKLHGYGEGGEETAQDLEKKYAIGTTILNSVIELRKKTNDVFAGLDDDE